MVMQLENFKGIHHRIRISPDAPMPGRITSATATATDGCASRRVGLRQRAIFLTRNVP